MEIPISSGRHLHFRAGIWISGLYLEHQNTKDLAPQRVRDARRYRSSHGDVPFLASHDRPQPGRVRDGFVCADETKSVYSLRELVPSCNAVLLAPQLPATEAVTIISK